MTEVERIVDQLHRGFFGDAWHGPSVLAALKDVSAGQANARPIPGAHSVWELVLHMTAWIDIVEQGVHDRKPEVTDEIDWPTVSDTSDSAWSDALRQLQGSEERLESSAGKLDADRMDQIVTGSESSIYRLLHGVVQHNLYHAGQIILLRKML